MIIYPDLMPILWTLMDFFMGFLWFLNGKLNGDFMDLAGIGWDFMGLNIGLHGVFYGTKALSLRNCDLYHGTY